MSVRPIKSRTGAIRHIYREQFRDPRRERRLWSALSFGTTFGITRAITHSLKGSGGSGGIEIGGVHVHHLAFGIAGLLGGGYAMVEGVGIRDGRRHRRAARTVASAYGASAALVLDEFALWLDLEDDYWSKEGRKSVDAAVIFGNVLTLLAVGRGLVAEGFRLLARRDRTAAARLAARAIRHRPRAALSVGREAA